MNDSSVDFTSSFWYERFQEDDNLWFENYPNLWCFAEVLKSTYVAILLPVLLLALALYYSSKPLNLQRDFYDVGFDYLTDGSYKSKRFNKLNKKEMVRNMQKLRKLGELPPVYPNGWFAIAESDDVRPGEVKYVSALGEHFAVFRSGEGELNILDAYCPHLGANMAVGGTVRENCLKCPFHGWEFDGRTGECTSVPYSEKTPRFIKVKKWLAREVNSIVFVWYHAEKAEPDWFPEEIDTIKSRGWLFQGRSEFFVGCHIQEIPENGADVAHLNAIHSPSLFGGHDLRFYEKLYLNFMKHVWTAEWKQSAEESHKANLSLTFETKIFDKFSFANMKVAVEQIGPGYVVLEMDTTWGPMLLLQVVTPVEPLLQRVVHRMYAPWQQSVMAKLTLYAELIMFERDVMVWNHKAFMKKPQLVKEDSSILRFRRWYCQFYSDSSPQFTYRKTDLSW